MSQFMSIDWSKELLNEFLHKVWSYSSDEEKRTKYVFENLIYIDEIDPSYWIIRVPIDLIEYEVQRFRVGPVPISNSPSRFHNENIVLSRNFILSVCPKQYKEVTLSFPLKGTYRKGKCPICNAAGRIIRTCNMCMGRGFIPCPRCGGSGVIYVSGYYQRCPVCGGGGAVLCPRCGGYGKVIITCPTCKGERYVALWEEIRISFKPVTKYVGLEKAPKDLDLSKYIKEHYFIKFNISPQEITFTQELNIKKIIKNTSICIEKIVSKILTDIEIHSFIDLKIDLENKLKEASQNLHFLRARISRILYCPIAITKVKIIGKQKSEAKIGIINGSNILPSRECLKTWENTTRPKAITRKITTFIYYFGIALIIMTLLDWIGLNIIDYAVFFTYKFLALTPLKPYIVYIYEKYLKYPSTLTLPIVILLGGTIVHPHLLMPIWWVMFTYIIPTLVAKLDKPPLPHTIIVVSGNSMDQVKLYIELLELLSRKRIKTYVGSYADPCKKSLDELSNTLKKLSIIILTRKGNKSTYIVFLRENDIDEILEFGKKEDKTLSVSKLFYIGHYNMLKAIVFNSGDKDYFLKLFTEIKTKMNKRGYECSEKINIFYKNKDAIKFILKQL